MSKNNNYSIIIPVYNEIFNISQLLNGLKTFTLDNQNEIIIVDDGSNDGTESLLKNCRFISLIRLKVNNGKGVAIKSGLKKAQHNKVILFDGDMELSTCGIKKMMILNKKRNIECVFGSRYKSIFQFKSFWDFGNLAFTSIFNLIHKSNISDSLCCAKAFYKSDINPSLLTSESFDIDVEIAKVLTKKLKINTIHLNYCRRGYVEGKKLKISDGWTILKSIIWY